MGIQDSLDTLYNTSFMDNETPYSQKINNGGPSRQQDSFDTLYKSLAETVITQIPDKILVLLGETRGSLELLPEKDLLHKLESFMLIAGALEVDENASKGLKNLIKLTGELRMSMEG